MPNRRDGRPPPTGIHHPERHRATRPGIGLPSRRGAQVPVDRARRRGQFPTLPSALIRRSDASGAKRCRPRSGQTSSTYHAHWTSGQLATGKPSWERSSGDPCLEGGSASHAVVEGRAGTRALSWTVFGSPSVFGVFWRFRGSPDQPVCREGPEAGGGRSLRRTARRGRQRAPKVRPDPRGQPIFDEPGG